MLPALSGRFMIFQTTQGFVTCHMFLCGITYPAFVLLLQEHVPALNHPQAVELQHSSNCLTPSIIETSHQVKLCVCSVSQMRTLPPADAVPIWQST
jgi:hypothetical protein